MKKLNKYAKVGIILCLAAVLLATSLWGNGSVEAAPSRMSGVQKVVNNISETEPFTVVEIVPDKSDATFGFLVEGYEPEVPGALLKTVEGEEARREAAIDWLNGHAGGKSDDGETMISDVSSDIYEEQLYEPENSKGWTVLYFQGDYTEQRTGSFKEAVDYGLEKGSYDASGNYVGEDSGDYVWVDGEGSTQNVEIHRIYCRMNYTSNNWFAENILESEDANIEVKTMTPQGFESMLSIGGISWNNVDMLYLNASNETKYVKAGTNANDFAEWSTCVQIYNQAVGAKLPVILDDRIMQDASDEGTNIRNLAYLLKAYNANLTVDVPLDEAVLNQAKTEAAAKTQSIGVCENVYFGTKFVDVSLVNILDDFYGKDAVLAEFENENFYHEVNNTDYTSERKPNGSYELSPASLMKYAVHIGNKRVETTKEKIKVLDIEPTKYSLLQEEDIRNWLGDYAIEETMLAIEIVQTSTAEFNGKMFDLVEEFDLIYVGSYDGPSLEDFIFTGGLNNVDGIISYNDASLNGLIYSDVGDIVTVPASEGFAGNYDSQYDSEQNLVTRYSGNDITEAKKRELQEFVDCGYPVVIANNLYQVDNTIDKGKVRESSYMYQFMNANTGKNSVGNVIRERDEALPQLDRYVNLSKLTLSIMKSPTEYEITYEGDGVSIESVQGLEKTNTTVWDEETGESQQIRTSILEYSFEFKDDIRVLGDGMYYKLQLFLDADADGQYAEYEELHGIEIRDIAGNLVEADQIKPNTLYWVTKDMGSSYEGVLSWKLNVALCNAEGEKLAAQSSVKGMTYVETTSQNNKVNALQLKVLEDDWSIKDGIVGNLINDLVTNNVYNISIEETWLEAFLTDKSEAEVFYEYLCNYDMLIIGFSDNYVERIAEAELNSKFFESTMENAVAAIEMYIEAGYPVVFTHDTTTYKSIDPDKNYFGYLLNDLVRKNAGMDRYSVLDVDTESDTDMAGKEGYSNTLLDRLAIINEESDTQKYHSVSYEGVNFGETTSLISQVNKGQITSFPYDVNIDSDSDSTYIEEILGSWVYGILANRIPNARVMTPNTAIIQPTNAQHYQLELEIDNDQDENGDLIVWYSMAGGMGGTGTLPGAGAMLTASTYSAMPNDARNNYFIYSIDNVTYTAMGYSSELSNYEAKLLVNTLITAYSLGIQNPLVNIVNDKEDKGDVIYEIYRPYDEEAQIFCETDQEIYFYVKDRNVITGSKNVIINAYYEVLEKTDKETIGENGQTVYLKAFAEPEIYEQEIVDKYVEEFRFQVDDHIYETKIDKTLLNQVFAGEPNMNVYIGVQVELLHDSGRVTQTQETFAVLEIKKMSLFNLD